MSVWINALLIIIICTFLLLWLSYCRDMDKGHTCIHTLLSSKHYCYQIDYPKYDLIYSIIRVHERRDWNYLWLCTLMPLNHIFDWVYNSLCNKMTLHTRDEYIHSILYLSCFHVKLLIFCLLVMPIGCPMRHHISAYFMYLVSCNLLCMWSIHAQRHCIGYIT